MAFGLIHSWKRIQTAFVLHKSKSNFSINNLKFSQKRRRKLKRNVKPYPKNVILKKYLHAREILCSFETRRRDYPASDVDAKKGGIVRNLLSWNINAVKSKHFETTLFQNLHFSFAQTMLAFSFYYTSLFTFTQIIWEKSSIRILIPLLILSESPT